MQTVPACETNFNLQQEHLVETESSAFIADGITDWLYYCGKRGGMAANDSSGRPTSCGNGSIGYVHTYIHTHLFYTAIGSR